MTRYHRGNYADCGRAPKPEEETSTLDGRRTVYGAGAVMQDADTDLLLLKLREVHGEPRRDLFEEAERNTR